MADDEILDLASVYRVFGATDILWELLLERDIATVGISHRKMPTFEKHREFVRSMPYRDWCIVRRIRRPSWIVPLGAVYMTDRFEIGVQIFKAFQRQGAGEWAVREIMKRNVGAPRYLANINPRNEASLALFRKLGFTDFQVTLHLERSDDATSKIAE